MEFSNYLWFMVGVIALLIWQYVIVRGIRRFVDMVTILMESEPDVQQWIRGGIDSVKVWHILRTVKIASEGYATPWSEFEGIKGKFLSSEPGGTYTLYVKIIEAGKYKAVFMGREWATDSKQFSEIKSKIALQATKERITRFNYLITSHFAHDDTVGAIFNALVKAYIDPDSVVRAEVFTLSVRNLLAATSEADLQQLKEVVFDSLAESRVPADAITEARDYFNKGEGNE